MNFLLKIIGFIGRKTAAVCVFVFLAGCISTVPAQNSEVFTINAEDLQNGKSVDLTKVGWKYQPGDDPNWGNSQFDDSGWKVLQETVVKPEDFPQSEWNGRNWFRLHFKIDETLADKHFALITWQTGASEIFLDGRQIAKFGTIRETDEFEFNPNRLPVLFQLDAPGEHVLAVRFSNSDFASVNTARSNWLIKGEIFPTFSSSLKIVDNAPSAILAYANNSSMRTGIFFVGILIGLAFLHFLLYIFYRSDRANLFYSCFALAFAINMICGNLRAFGHQSTMSNAILRIAVVFLLAVMFVSLLAFMRTAFEQTLGKIFWAISAVWLIACISNALYLNNLGNLRLLTNIAIFLSFSYSIFLVAKALRFKRNDAWILLIGVQVFAVGMFSTLVNQFSLIDLPGWVFELGEVALILALPIAVSIFLARSVARTNRELKTQLAQVETLSVQKIEQEKKSAELRAENERRAKELEEARQLQLSMLPNKLPKIANLEIAAYMKPATEVGGDYYDFHIGKDGTLTIAVGDATGHGLKAGTVVTATKSLFNNLAAAPDIPDTLQQISVSLKAMNLRGLFMAMTLIKFKDNNLSICAAGMPSTLIYRAATEAVEEINIRALPLGGMTNFKYRGQEISLETGDCVMVMSDGFPEMFNPDNEMLGFEKAAEVLTEIAVNSPQEIIDRFVEVSQKWANGRPADDDVTFVVLKVGGGQLN